MRIAPILVIAVLVACVTALSPAEAIEGEPSKLAPEGPPVLRVAASLPELWLPPDAAPALRAGIEDSTTGYKDPKCSTEEGKRSTCSAKASKTRCSAVQPGRECSAFNEDPNTAGYQCSVLQSFPKSGIGSAQNAGNCSTFGDNGGPTQCSVAPGSGGTCSARGTGGCSANGPNTCSVIGQPSSSGLCQG